MRVERFGASFGSVYKGELTGYEIPEDRYVFDFKLMPTGQWAQVDHSSDFFGHGVWANPYSRKLVTWCEGDLYIVHCDTDAEFVERIREDAAFDTFKGIDPFLNQKLRDRFVELGLAEFLH